MSLYAFQERDYLLHTQGSQDSSSEKKFTCVYSQSAWEGGPVDTGGPRDARACFALGIQSFLRLVISGMCTKLFSWCVHIVNQVQLSPLFVIREKSSD